jgi:hypothetical protein
MMVLALELLAGGKARKKREKKGKKPGDKGKSQLLRDFITSRESYLTHPAPELEDLQ